MSDAQDHGFGRAAVVVAASAGTFWLLMMCIHESGHVIAALCMGGHVVRVVLHPLAISRTDVSPNTGPLVVAWGGPVWGSVFPVILWGAWRVLRWPGAKWLKALAGFCLIANGLYVASGMVFPAGDTEEMLRLGVPRWVLAAIGMPAVVAGLWMWHALGPRFGTSTMTIQQQRRAAWLLVIGLLVLAGGMLAYSRLISAA